MSIALLHFDLVEVCILDFDVCGEQAEESVALYF